MAYSAISIKGGKKIVKAVGRVALKRTLDTGEKQTVGELVYNAMLNTYGQELEDAISFFENNGVSNHQLDVEVSASELAS